MAGPGSNALEFPLPLSVPALLTLTNTVSGSAACWLGPRATTKLEANSTTQKTARVLVLIFISRQSLTSLTGCLYREGVAGASQFLRNSWPKESFPIARKRRHHPPQNRRRSRSRAPARRRARDGRFVLHETV